jgi:hypothetical protein
MELHNPQEIVMTEGMRKTMQHSQQVIPQNRLFPQYRTSEKTKRSSDSPFYERGVSRLSNVRKMRFQLMNNAREVRIN